LLCSGHDGEGLRTSVGAIPVHRLWAWVKALTPRWPIGHVTCEIERQVDVQFCTADKLSIRYRLEVRPFNPLIDKRLEALTPSSACQFIRRALTRISVSTPQIACCLLGRSTPRFSGVDARQKKGR
jgi:hypothetical protein